MRSRSMQKLTDELKARYPGVVIYGVGDDAHKLRISDHNEDDTAGSLSAQTDPDTIPEHRAIDVMLGTAFTKAQASALIGEILANELDKARLWYINFLNDQWSRTTSWVKHDNSDDPHPDHIHFSGLASQDDNVSPWLTGVGDDMRATLGMGSATAPNDSVLNLQRKMLYLVAGDPRLTEHPLVVDGGYGPKTAYWVSVLLTGGAGSDVNGAWFAVLDEMILEKKIADTLANVGGQLPDSVTFTIPSQTVTAPLLP